MRWKLKPSHHIYLKMALVRSQFPVKYRCVPISPGNMLNRHNPAGDDNCVHAVGNQNMKGKRSMENMASIYRQKQLLDMT